MPDLAALEKEILNLPPAERERFALLAWESLVADPAAGSLVDPEGVAIALERDAAMESDSVKPIDHAEFLRRTGGAVE